MAQASAGDATVRSLDFDSHLTNTLPAKRYQPLVFAVDHSQITWSSFSQIQLICDTLYAFQTNHKLAAQHLMKIYVGESLKESFHLSVIQGILTYVLNHDEAESSSQSISNHSSKPACFYTQVTNIII